MKTYELVKVIEQEVRLCVSDSQRADKILNLVYELWEAAEDEGANARET